jgi:hypothetical protein
MYGRLYEYDKHAETKSYGRGLTAAVKEQHVDHSHGQGYDDI